MSSSAASILTPGPGSKSRSTENSKPVGASIGPGRPREAAQASEPRANPAKEKLKAIASDMASGKISSREQRVDEDEPLREPSEVSDSGAIAPVKDPPKPEPQAQQTEKPAKPAKETEEEKSAKAKRVLTAKRALALDGWTPEEIEELEESKLLRIGEHRAKNQADVNREFAKLRNAAEKAPRNPDGTFAASQDAKPAEGKEEKETSKPAAAVDDDPEIAALLSSTEEELGPVGTKVIKTVAGILAKRMNQQTELGSNLTRELMYSQGLDILEKEYPDQLAANPAAFEDVVENFKALANSNRYGRGQISKAWKDAAYMAFGPPNATRKAQRAMLARQQAADDGYVDPGRGDTGATTEAALSSKDALKMAAQMMAANSRANPERLREEIMARARGRR